MSRYRILAIDGGGIRGIVTTILLDRLSSDPELAGWLDSVDLIAGTSTGGLIALGLAHGLSPAELGQFYEERGPVIFERRWAERVRNPLKLRRAVIPEQQPSSRTH